MPTRQRSKIGPRKKGLVQALRVRVNMEGGSLRKSARQSRGDRLRSRKARVSRDQLSHLVGLGSAPLNGHLRSRGCSFHATLSTCTCPALGQPLLPTHTKHHLLPVKNGGGGFGLGPP